MNPKLKIQIELETLHELIDELDYYQLLRLPRNCSQADIVPAYREESRRLHPDQFSDHSAELKTKINYIYTAINEAHAVLKEPEQRLTYNAMLENGVIRSEDSALNVSEQRASINDPASAATTDQSKKFWVRGLEAFEKEDYKGAILNIKFAIQFEPKNEIFKEWLEKAEEADKKAPQKEKNPFKLRL
jgi:curved DNA-binding protein CbpA